MPDDPQQEIRDFARGEINHFSAALSIAVENGDRHGEAENLGNLGWIYCWHTKDGVDKAIDYHQQAISVAREIGAKGLEAESLEGLAECYGHSWHDKGDYLQATVFFEASLEIAREVGDRERESHCLELLGDMQTYQGKNEQALPLYEQALVIAREIDHRQYEANILHNIGFSNHQLGRLQEAMQSFEQAVLIYEAHEADRYFDYKHHSEALEYGHIASVYFDLGEEQQAMKAYERGLAIARENGRDDTYILQFKEYVNQPNDSRPKTSDDADAQNS